VAGRVGGALVAFALALAAGACGSSSGAVAFPTGRLEIAAASGTVVLDVEIAETEAARRLGLMGRIRLDADAGMVFLLDEPAPARFWMKDTLIPLSIAFWEPGGHIVAIFEMTPCLADPCPLYGPDQRVAGAVEAGPGYFAAHEVKLGDRVRLDRSG
jgi:uncharacterized membrane protein (UPF0127 family)